MDEWEINKRDEGQTKTTKDTESHTKRSFLIACIIFSLALTIRLVYLYESSANPSFRTPIVDSKTYDEIARAFVKGQGLGYKFFWQPFFYPFFLSVVYFFSGCSIIAAKVIQVLLGALTCALTYRLGEKIFNRRIGIIAGLITVFYGPMFFYDSELLATGWASLLAVVIVLLFMKVREKDKGRYWFFLGLCGALGIITRPEFFLFFLAGCIWLWLHVPRGLPLLPRFGAIFAGIALVTMPVGFAAMYATAKFSIISSSGGINLYIGNNPNYCQTLTIRPGEEWDKLVKLPSQYGMGDNVWDEDRFFKQQVLEYVKSQPLDFAKGLGRKTLELICSREIPRNLNIYMFSRWSWLLRLSTWKADGFGFPFGLIFPLAVLGAVFNWRRIPAPVILFIVLYPLSIILVFVAGRYKVPLVPILAILAAAGLVSAIKSVQLRRREVIKIAVVIVGTVLLSTLPGPFCQEQIDLEPEFFQLVGRAMAKDGLNDEAMKCFTESLRLKPDWLETYYYAAGALIQQNKVSEAINYYSYALRMKPDYPRAHADLGVALDKLGKTDEAIEHYKEALQLKPDIPEVYYNLGIIFERQGKLDEAIEHYREALRLRPDFPEAREKLAYALAQQSKSKDSVQP
jgi:cytochrome c-type biogenesis protein CcmH/NrfG/4-amino-4-deoxy-L-arabinose transferase-like glycosyltransferase